MRISVTGNKGFSLVEVLLTLTIIGVCYVSIAKGLIDNIKVNQRIEVLSKGLLDAKRYFVDFEESTNKNVKTRVETAGKGLSIHTFEYQDGHDNKILEFKGYALEK